MQVSLSKRPLSGGDKWYLHRRICTNTTDAGVGREATATRTVTIAHEIGLGIVLHHSWSKQWTDKLIPPNNVIFMFNHSLDCLHHLLVGFRRDLCHIAQHFDLLWRLNNAALGDNRVKDLRIDSE